MVTLFDFLVKSNKKELFQKYSPLVTGFKSKFFQQLLCQNVASLAMHACLTHFNSYTQDMHLQTVCSNSNMTRLPLAIL